MRRLKQVKTIGTPLGTSLPMLLIAGLAWVSVGCGSAAVRYTSELQQVRTLIQNGHEGEAQSAIQAVLAKSDGGKNLAPEDRLELQILAADKSCYLATHAEPYFVPADLSSGDELKLTMAREEVSKTLKKAREEYRTAERLAADLDFYSGEIEYRINLGIAHCNLRLAALADLAGTEDRSGLFGACEQQLRRCEAIATQSNNSRLLNNPRLLYLQFWLAHCQQQRREKMERGDKTPEQMAEAFKETRFQLYKAFAEFMKTQNAESREHSAYRDMLDYVYPYQNSQRLAAECSNIAEAYFECLNEYQQQAATDLGPAWGGFHGKLKGYLDNHQLWHEQKKIAADAIAFARSLRDNPNLATSREDLSQGIERLRAVPKSHHDADYRAIRGALEDRMLSLYLAWGEEQLAAEDFDKASMAANQVYDLGNNGVNADPAKGRPSSKFSNEEQRWQNLSRDAKAGQQYKQLVAQVEQELRKGVLANAQALLESAASNPDLKGDFVKGRIEQLSASLFKEGEATMEIAKLVGDLQEGVKGSKPNFDALVERALRANQLSREHQVAEIFSQPAASLFREVMLGAKRFDEIVAAWEGIPSLTPSERIDLAYCYAMKEDYESAAKEFDLVGKLEDAGFRDERHRLEVLKVAAKSNLKVGNRSAGSRLYSAAVKVANRASRGSVKLLAQEITDDYQDLLSDESLDRDARIGVRSDFNSFREQLTGFETQVKDNLKNLFLLMFEAGSSGDVTRYEEAFQRWSEYQESGGTFSDLGEAERNVAVLLTACFANYMPLVDGARYTYRSEDRSTAITHTFKRIDFGEFKVSIDLGGEPIEETWSRNPGSGVARVLSEHYTVELLVNLDPKDFEARRRSNGGYTCQIVSIGNTITCDRPYDGCIEVHVTRDDEDESDPEGRFRLVYWLAPEVGIVKFKDPGGTFLLSALQR